MLPSTGTLQGPSSSATYLAVFLTRSTSRNRKFAGKRTREKKMTETFQKKKVNTHRPKQYRLVGRKQRRALHEMTFFMDPSSKWGKSKHPRHHDSTSTGTALSQSLAPICEGNSHHGLRHHAHLLAPLKWFFFFFCLSPDLQQYVPTIVSTVILQDLSVRSQAWHFGLDTPVAKTRGRWRLLLSQPPPFHCLSQVTISKTRSAFSLYTSLPTSTDGSTDTVHWTGSQTELLCLSIHNHHLIVAQDPRLRLFVPSFQCHCPLCPIRRCAPWVLGRPRQAKTQFTTSTHGARCQYRLGSHLVSPVRLCGWPRRLDRLNTYKGCTARPKNDELSFQKQ
ncbi:hypothetical protein BDP81DRAFT_435874 [Colletotrichum phormii]|uniref:Uncharacterized protein n=1 Tax=Colletotrichum phormii TaxID=359342 RepID=A0AAJ0EAU2_9PEZI|nr:uncharacterized protein BDP81DRAFT_435874 [Colletotrichum phormii]KAK1625469.1 hypothetical protein BDP81DRAFT_435874 [Colletotrichum phormii]